MASPLKETAAYAISLWLAASKRFEVCAEGEGDAPLDAVHEDYETYCDERGQVAQAKGRFLFLLQRLGHGFGGTEHTRTLTTVREKTSVVAERKVQADDARAKYIQTAVDQYKATPFSTGRKGGRYLRLPKGAVLVTWCVADRGWKAKLVLSGGREKHPNQYCVAPEEFIEGAVRYILSDSFDQQ
jgi:hypothetical protein